MPSACTNLEFRIWNFEFSVPRRASLSGNLNRRDAVAKVLIGRAAKRHTHGCLGVLRTKRASSTVDNPQSASKAIYHSYLSESRGGPGPTWLSEGGWAGGGNRVRGRWPARMQPAGAFTGGAWHPGRGYWRCLASRHDVVLNVMSACLAPHGERFENGSRVGVPGTSREECAKPVRTRGKRCSESPWSWAPGCRPSPPP
jgi:hypothetical protein